MTDMTLFGQSPFDAIRRVDESGEHWDGRELALVMNYGRWQEFATVIEKARASLAVVQGEEQVAHHFVVRHSDGGRWGNQRLDNYRLTRFAAYLVAMAGEHTKQPVAEARIYFAVKTREAEVAKPALPSRRELAQMVIDAEDRAEAAETTAAAAISVVKELAPSAQAWDQLADTGATLDVGSAAKKLRENGILIGRTRLYAYLREIGWVFQYGTEPKQAAVDTGYLTVDWGKTFVNEKTGETQQGNAKSRVTTAGLRELQRRLAPSGAGAA